MSRPRIAIFGASGFVGSALVERLFFDRGLEFKALIHSFGNAARLTRLPITVTPVDVLDIHQVKEALSGCSVAVNCSRGEGAMMVKGLRNMIRASQESGIEKFIHIGSIAIYGNDPSPETMTEVARPDPGAGAYEKMKLKQDEMVFRLHASGVPAMILCPSNISGPYSPFVLGAVQSLLSDEIVLVDDGKYPTNLVHVDNLVEAILRAIESDVGWGERYFVNEIEITTWKEFFEELQQMLGLSRKLSSVSREEVLKQVNKTKKNSSISNNIRLLMSKRVRDAMSVVPIFESMQEFAAEKFSRLDPKTQAKMREKLNGPRIIRKETVTANLANPFVKVQVRQVYHSPEKIISRLKYTPLLDHRQRRETTECWFEFINIGKR